jgi:hypothetical protein
VPVPSESTAAVSQAPSAAVVSPRPGASPSNRPSPTVQLELATEFREHCGSIGGCAAYVALVNADEADAVENAFTELGVPRPKPPALISPGSYTVRFRLAAVSDDRQVGAPPDESTIATCEVPIEVFNQAAVTVSVTFDRDSCEASATYTIVIID